MLHVKFVILGNSEVRMLDGGPMILPGMCEGLLASIALVDIDAHQLVNEVLGRVADIVPVRRIKFKFTYNSLVSSLL